MKMQITHTQNFAFVNVLEIKIHGNVSGIEEQFQNRPT